ncbi:serine-type D-Ala-D-Ala carboxypeptidase [Pantoea agglomerans]|uniref:serine hydrolase n=1 Tax=Pantoea TaxID=53335 RepID=UPI000900666F|nr:MULTISPECIES: serine hydrolase [Pantoea]AMG60252.2 serine-type D-Ala-D-Ala carboxypeptidase [Pantoea vagans]PEI03210.1 serine-type D-Ala-D-Ala carboxypeptidase [Pantoea agglomerans]GME33969.1 serine-type D-Ala-D-Ala carboxypeptidase [Pantoea sp. QMID3]GME34280.1 serine-type D-Ala-D-Ala carboxypeptidase [Pantoea sp. QMID1]GME55739.1 serine-type D-Ala-D-Ala carboxypeptidase [Pantoea sp. QMID4]
MTNTRFTSRLRHLVATSLLIIAPISAFAEQAPAAPGIDAKAWILIDYASGKVLTESSADQRLDPASLTKMMTSYVVGQAIKAGKIKPDDLVTVGQDAWATGNPKLRGSSLMFLKPGDRIPVHELNKGIVIQSGNDACIALADYVAGSQDSFIGLMNNYVKALGLQNTHFMTVHGLDAEGQYSTARDMALIAQALIRDVPEEYALNKEKEFTFNKIRQINRNRLLWSTNLKVDGVKTGHTSGAGNNLVASATEGDMRLISVVLGTASDAIRFRESEKLLTWGFRFFETVTPIKADAPFAQQRVWFGDKSQVNLGVAKDAALTIPKGQMKNLKASFRLTTPQLEAPLKKNQVVGTIDFQLDGKTIEQRPLVVLQDVPEGGFFSRMIDFVMMKFNGWFGKWLS